MRGLGFDGNAWNQAIKDAKKLAGKGKGGKKDSIKIKPWRGPGYAQVRSGMGVGDNDIVPQRFNLERQEKLDRLGELKLGKHELLAAPGDNPLINAGFSVDITGI